MSCYFLLLIVKKYIRISLVKLPQLEPFCFVLEEQYVRPSIEHHVLGGSSFWIVMKFLLLILAAFVVLLKKVTYSFRIIENLIKLCLLPELSNS